MGLFFPLYGQNAIRYKCRQPLRDKYFHYPCYLLVTFVLNLIVCRMLFNCVHMRHPHVKYLLFKSYRISGDPPCHEAVRSVSGRFSYVGEIVSLPGWFHTGSLIEYVCSKCLIPGMAIQDISQFINVADFIRAELIWWFPPGDMCHLDSITLCMSSTWLVMSNTPVPFWRASLWLIIDGLVAFRPTAEPS